MLEAHAEAGSVLRTPISLSTLTQASFLFVLLGFYKVFPPLILDFITT